MTHFFLRPHFGKSTLQIKTSQIKVWERKVNRSRVNRDTWSEAIEAKSIRRINCFGWKLSSVYCNLIDTPFISRETLTFSHLFTNLLIFSKDVTLFLFHLICTAILKSIDLLTTCFNNDLAFSNFYSRQRIIRSTPPLTSTRKKVWEIVGKESSLPLYNAYKVLLSMS